jgi:hypothetical protein
LSFQRANPNASPSRHSQTPRQLRQKGRTRNHSPSPVGSTKRSPHPTRELHQIERWLPARLNPSVA